MAGGSGADWIEGPGVAVGAGAGGGGGGAGVGAGGAGVGAAGGGGGGALAMGVVPPGEVDSEALLPPPQPASDREPQAAEICHRN